VNELSSFNITYEFLGYSYLLIRQSLRIHFN